ncbi:RNA polymerase sigma factor region1.1 domain-containing protein, partial [Patescibacteria group bacterium]|nr:RNA polymerase sigma factor region1.1 domain-containing protein [Patescibacteria group bacterium]
MASKPRKLKPVDVSKLIRKAKKEGFVLQEEVMKIFPDAEKRIEELDELYDKLFKAKIDVFDTVEEDLKNDVKVATKLQKELATMTKIERVGSS